MIKLKELLKEVSKPKLIDASYIERSGKLYSIKVDGKKVDASDIQKAHGLNIPAKYDESSLRKKKQQFAKYGIKFTYDDSMDVS